MMSATTIPKQAPLKPRFSLTLKLFASFLAISLVPLGVVLFLNMQATRTSLDAVAYKSLFASASHTALRLNGFIKSHLDVIHTEAQLPILSEFLNLPPEQQKSTASKTRLNSTLTSLVKKKQFFLSSYALLDISGKNIFDTDYTNIGADLSHRSYFQQVLETGLPFVSDVEFNQNTGEAFLYFSSPVRDSKGSLGGVLRARYSAAILQQLIIHDTGLVGPSSFGMLVNSNHLILAYGVFSHGGAEKMVFNPIVNIPKDKVKELQLRRLFPPDSKKKNPLNIPTLEKGLLTADSLHPYFTSVLPSTGDRVFAAAITRMEQEPWLVAFFQPRDAFLAPAEERMKETLVLAIIIFALVSIAALVWADYISRPIRELTKVAERITQGDLSAVYTVQTNDEIGVLANTFNFMTRRLRRRIEIESLISSISRKFIYIDSANMELAIDQALETIGNFAGVDRCVLFLATSSDCSRLQIANDWPRHDILTVPEKLRTFFSEEHPKCMHLLKHEEHISIIDTKQSTDSSVRFWQDRGARSVYYIALMRAGMVCGFVGFETINEPRDWLPVDTYLLRMTGEIISSTLERQRAEKDKEKVEEQLRHSAKMEAVGTLAGGIAHDFNNLLQGISGYIQLLLIKKTQQDKDRVYLEKASQAATRAAELVQRLLTLSRKSDAKLKPVNINDVITNSVDLLERTIPKMVAITSHLASDLSLVQADAIQIEQVVVNLANNAVDAMTGSGSLVIETENFIVHTTYHNSHIELQPGEYSLIQISDNGKGMDDRTHRRIFEPFFTTKKVGKGTGLGLATVYNIIKDHKGHIVCYTEPGQGTTFKIYLPAANTLVATEKSKEAYKIIPSGKEFILLVDDEKDILDTTERFLTELGYTVYTASSAEEALNFYQTKKAAISLVIMDLGMPGMGGEKGLEKLIKCNSNLKIIIVSGYSAHKIAKNPEHFGAIRFVGKPYNFKQLACTIREVLEKEKQEG